MGFLCQTPTPTSVPTVSSTETQLPAWYQQALQSLDVQSSNIANAPYQPFSGQQIAGFTPAQQQSFNLTQQNVGNYLPNLNQAGNLTAQGAQAFPTANMSDYMNPYVNNVINVQQQYANQQFARQQQQLANQAVKSGNFGNTRYGIESALGKENQNLLLNNIAASGLQNAFQQGMQQFNNDQTRALQAGNQFANLAGATQNMGIKDAASLGTIGQQQQQQQQQNLNVAYQNFLNQRDYAKDQASWLSNIIRGQNIPANQTTTGQKFQDQMSPISAAAGIGQTALGLYGLTQSPLVQSMF